MTCDMTCVELFAGAGGAAAGLMGAGLSHLLCVDHDEDCVATLQAAGLPGLLSDLSTAEGRASVVSALEGRRPDLVWASPPCQPWSAAGQRRGGEDSRDGWPWTLAVLDDLRPTWVLGENVAGMTHAPARPYLEGLLAELRRRYAYVGWWVLDCADYGVPQRRVRLIVWCGPRPLSPPARTHAEPPTHHLLGLRPWMSMGEALPHLVGVTVSARDAARSPLPVTMPREPERLLRPSPCVTTTEEKGTRASRSSGWTMHGGPDRASDAAWLATGRRRLTVEECCALQAFPPQWPWRARTRSSGYRMCGNAVPPPFASAIARTLPGPTMTHPYDCPACGEAATILVRGQCPACHDLDEVLALQRIEEGYDPPRRPPPAMRPPADPEAVEW